MDPADESISAMADFDLDDKIEDYEKHQAGLKTVDGGAKIRSYLGRLLKEKARRERIQTESCEQVTPGVHVIEDVDMLDLRLKGKTTTVEGDSQCSPSSGPDFHMVERESSDNEPVLLVQSSPPKVTDPETSQRRGGSKDDQQRGTCTSCQKKLAPLKSLPRVTQGELALCRRCKKKKKLAASDPWSPMNKEAKKGGVRQLSMEHLGLRLGLAKRACKSVGDTLDTAMDISDDEEPQMEVNDTSAAQHSGSDSVKRPRLRSTSKLCQGMKVLYPSRDDPDAIEVQYDDLDHLNPHEFLNDTVIDFYIKYLQTEKFANKEILCCFHFFNSFFYKKLRIAKEAGSDEHYHKLHNWTRGVNIFKKTYLLMPVHDKAHWSLAIICFSKGTECTCLLHLDSVAPPLGHSSDEIFDVLKCYLAAEKTWMLQHKQGTEDSAGMVPSGYIKKIAEVPLQDNEWDCGLFMLYYIERFVQGAPLHFTPSDLDNMFGRNWFKPKEASKLRDTIFELLHSIFCPRTGSNLRRPPN